jgi:uncharacterized protein
MEVTALLLGFGGSLHCALMCSPLAAAAIGNARAMRRTLLYNAGRILTYSLLGGLIASLGRGIPIAGFQLLLTIVMAATLILMGLAGVSTLRVPLISLLLSKVTNAVKILFAKFFKQKTQSSFFILGMLNGILPCGLTFLALSYCLTLAGPLSGMSFMLLFGIGTLPAMLGLTSVIQFFLKYLNFPGSRMTRLAFIAIGMIMLARLVLVDHHTAVAHAALSAGQVLICR